MELGSGWVDVLRDGDASPSETSEMKVELSSDAQFVSRFFRLMTTCETDFTDTWRALLDVPALSMVPKATSPAGLKVRVGKEGIAGGQASTSVGLDEGSTRVPGGNRNRDSTAEGWSTRDGDAPEVTDEEALRPLFSVLRATGVSSDRMRGWAGWTREYMARIDTQVRECERFSRSFCRATHIRTICYQPYPPHKAFATTPLAWSTHIVPCVKKQSKTA